VEINKYFNQLQHMFEADGPQNEDFDWKSYENMLNQYLETTQELKSFFQNFVNSNNQRTDNGAKKTVKAANGYLKKIASLEQTINNSKQVISESAIKELEALKKAIDEAKETFTKEGGSLEEPKSEQNGADQQK
jgi:hypothetical protein